MTLSRTEYLDLCVSPKDEVVEGSQAKPVPFLADCKQSPIVHSCLDNIYLYKRLRGYYLTRICILDMLLNHTLSSYKPIANQPS